MKKTILVLALSVLLLAACSAETTQNSKEAYIEKLPLTAAEQELVNLLNNGGNASIYHYAVNEDVKSLKIYLDVYQDGTLLDRKLSGAVGLNAAEGKMAVLPDQSSNTAFHLSIVTGSGGAYFNLQNALDVGALSQIDVPSNGPQAGIKATDTYALFARLFCKPESMFVYADTLSNPDRLKAYSYAYIISCEFSSDRLDSQSP
ncbi:hypothetical protein SAMN02745823_00852 [Sporobacter termitidis DSM 10068]|uniref:Lipoprotein n=1 Tax=Sporobacter termitidis DSM 10068 TaxID=1123282 RepID=A0A1M5VJA4_9FIRM|nr:hypothetical protein [Sporobacter termitidis]SHH75144.1 hypothetical protein SAMN02745823_00852 [Sporobacter termitidis DSM 10068]